MGLARDKQGGDCILGYPSRKSGVGEYFMVTIRDTEDIVLGQHVVRIYDDPRQERLGGIAT